MIASQPIIPRELQRRCCYCIIEVCLAFAHHPLYTNRYSFQRKLTSLSHLKNTHAHTIDNNQLHDTSSVLQVS